MATTYDESVYKQRCPMCGDNVVYDSTIQKLICHSCGTEYESGEIPEESGMVFKGQKWQSHEASMYHCPSCGGELICNKRDISVSCPYCGSNLILSDRLTESYKPNQIIPFKFDTDTAIEIVKEYLINSGMRPKEISDCRINNARGIYVPFWTYSSRVFGYTNVRCGRRGQSADKYDDRFIVGSAVYQSIPADAIRRLPDETSEAIEPFDFSEAEDFDCAYLSGFSAENYDVDMEECFDRVKKRMELYIDDLFRDEIKDYPKVYSGKTVIRVPTTLVNYVLCPIYLIDIELYGYKYRYTINGQTGKVDGQCPKSRYKPELKYKVAPWILQIIPILFLAFTDGLTELILVCASELVIIGGTIILYQRFMKSRPTVLEVNSSYYVRPKSKRILYNSDKALKIEINEDEIDAALKEQYHF